MKNIVKANYQKIVMAALLLGFGQSAAIAMQTDTIKTDTIKTDSVKVAKDSITAVKDSVKSDSIEKKKEETPYQKVIKDGGSMREGRSSPYVTSRMTGTLRCPTNCWAECCWR